jgi:hypothetical protein
MSDTPNEGVPNWLSQTAPAEGELTPLAPAFTLAAPPEAVAADPTTLTAKTENMGKAVMELVAVADALIKLKRFWQSAAGTSNERDAAVECAEFIIGIAEYVDKSQ